MSEQARVPATVLTGFLGSGKTTLLNWLLSQDHGFRAAVIVNELGDIGVDGQLVQGGGEQFVELDNGCLCCALNEDLEQLLRDLMARGGFDHLLLETTGVADPLPVAWAFNRPGLQSYFRLDAIVTVADAANLDAVLPDSEEARVQIERADILIVNKLDLTGDEGAAARSTLRELNPNAVFLDAVRGEVPWELVLSSRAPSQLATATVEQGHHHVHSAGHEASTRFETWTFETEGIFSDEGLEDWLYELPPSVYRLKGLVRTDEAWAWTAVNCVAGRFDMGAFEPDPVPARSALVFIGKGLDPTALQERLRALLKDA